MTVLVVVSYLRGETPFTSNRYDVQPVECVSVFDYGDGLAAAWSSGATVVNVEHDLEVSDGLIAELVDCPHPLCAHPYPIRSAGNIVYPYTAPDDPTTWCRPGAPWAVWAAPGFIKATPDVRTGPIPGETHWESVEQAVNQAVTGLWHLHWPAVKHYHQYDGGGLCG